jgi:fumarate hydratase class II
MHISAVLMVAEQLIPSLNLFANALGGKKEEFKDIIKIGRTHT